MFSRTVALAFLVLLIFIQPLIAGPDDFTPAVPICSGVKPAVAVDKAGKVHLIYAEEKMLWYRAGDSAGKFGEPELIMENDTDGPYWDPRVVLDQNGDLHVAVSNGHMPPPTRKTKDGVHAGPNRFTWYTNRIGGKWKPRLTVFDTEEDNLNRAITPHPAINENGDVYLGAFTVGAKQKPQGEQWGILALIKNAAGSPQVERKQKINVWNPQVLITSGELWIGGRNKIAGDRHFTFQRHDKQTLLELESPIQASGGVHGEMARAAVDASGELHAAGTLNSRESGGWYNTLSRAKAGQEPILYHTTNKNASGAAMPIKDLRANDRVYLLYWSGAEHHEHEPGPCAEGNQLVFTRIENGKLEAEAKSITTRTATHDYSRRATPPGAAHPEGGMVVIFQECGETPMLYFTRIGGDAAISKGSL